MCLSVGAFLLLIELEFFLTILCSRRYACGGWINNNPIPDDRASTSTFSKLADANDLAVRRILEAPMAVSEPYLNKPRQFYAACIDMESRDSDQGTATLAKLAASVTTGPLVTRLALLASKGVAALFYAGVGADGMTPDTNALFLLQAGLGLPSKDYYIIDSSFHKAVQAAYVDYCRRCAERTASASCGMCRTVCACVNAVTFTCALHLVLRVAAFIERGWLAGWV